MSTKRQIKNGKLDIVCQCVGGPQDGVLVSDTMGRVRFPVRKPNELLVNEGEIPNTMPDYDLDEYERVSLETFEYRGRA